MIDTIKGYLNTKSIGLISQVLKNPKPVQDTINSNGIISGYLENIFLRVYQFKDTKEIKIYFQGSINKFIHGNNIVRCTRADLIQGIRKMSELTNLPFKLATLNSFALGSNLLMDKPVLNYLNFLGNCKQYKKGYFQKGNNRSLYYILGNKKLLFYDKGQESKKILPSFLSEKYLLRYELTFQNSLAKQLNKAEINLSEICKEDTYIELLDRWYAEYTSIHKIHDINLTCGVNVNTYLQYLILQGIQSLNYDRVLNQLEVFRKNNRINSTQKFRIKKRLSQIIHRKDYITERTEDINELNQKMKLAIEFYR
jgi:hypothetical protein